jgi:hypothetical protein
LRLLSRWAFMESIKNRALKLVLRSVLEVNDRHPRITLPYVPPTLAERTSSAAPTFYGSPRTSRRAPGGTRLGCPGGRSNLPFRHCQFPTRPEPQRLGRFDDDQIGFSFHSYINMARESKTAPLLTAMFGPKAKRNQRLGREWIGLQRERGRKESAIRSLFTKGIGCLSPSR